MWHDKTRTFDGKVWHKTVQSNMITDKWNILSSYIAAHSSEVLTHTYRITTLMTDNVSTSFRLCRQLSLIFLFCI